MFLQDCKLLRGVLSYVNDSRPGGTAVGKGSMNQTYYDYDASPNAMSRLSMYCGIASLVSLCVNGSFFVGTFGIIFALLSKKERLNSQARIGLYLSTFSLAVFAVIFSVIFAFLKVSGLYDSIMSQAAAIDFSNPNAAVELEELIQEELIDYLRSQGVSLSPGAETPAPLGAGQSL